MKLTSRMKNGKISSLLNPYAEKQTFGRKSQNWPNLRDENGILLYIIIIIDICDRRKATRRYEMRTSNICTE
ncbi:hypothetical protein Hanom_Chr08g00754261 [Helianthus anomalus]